MKIIDCVQLSPEWWEARCGLPTASAFNRIMTSKGRPSDGIDGYIAELLAEKECQTPKYFTQAGKPSTPAMQRGTDLEPIARQWYETRIGRRVYSVGLCVTDDGRFGASPDFLADNVAGEDVCGEVKIYDDDLHAKWIKADTAPTQFLAQIHGQLLVTGRPLHHLVLWSETQEAKIIETRPGELTRQLRVCLEVFHSRFEKALKRSS